MRASGFFTADQRKEVEAAIQEAEGKTAAEFVCAIATESGRYDRAESLFGLGLALLGLVFTHQWSHFSALASGAWGAEQGPALGTQLVAVVAGFALGTLVASRWHGLRRLLVSRLEIEEEVQRAAAAVFSRKRLGSTRDKGGVLVYLSLFERKVAVWADTGAFRVLGQQAMDALRDAAVENLRAGRRVETFTAVLKQAAELLAPELPRSLDDPNELPDELLLFHPRP